MSLRKLASETAIYGLSSILGRGLYFLLTPLYTDIFTTFESGIQTDVFALLSFLMVLATFRLDIAYFRNYKSEDPSTLFATSFLTTAGIGMLLGGGLLFLSPWLGYVSGYPAYQWLFALAGGILLFDAMVELPLAKLRMEQRPWRFAVVRLTGIGVNLGLNIFWLYLLPKWPNAPEWLATPFAGITYIFLANIIASAAVFLLLTPELKSMKWQIDFKLLKKLLVFSSPLVVVGFSYIINEMLDRKLLPILWPGGKLEGLELLGVYGQNYKLAMLLALFTQAFRYGAEPFFFRESGAVGAQENYARLARYFLIASLFGFLVVSLFLPVFSQTFLQDDSYRVGSDVVPILLLANLCLGMYYNFSVWYKVTDKTKMGAYISLGGATITIVLNILLIPKYGFYGCAWTTLTCYLTMMAASWWLGRKHYPIPYDLKAMWAYTILALVIFGAYWQLSPKLGTSVLDLAISGGSNTIWLGNLGLGTAGLLLFAGAVWINERKQLRKLIT
jgi:O-antigen/teichoic acid export membrane protein